MADEKNVDESWKESIESEKIIGSDPQGSSDAVRQEGEGENFEVNFMGYLTSLAFQAMIFLGEIPNPITEKIEKNLTQAKLLIDTLAMLKDKTQGNLASEEDNALSAFLYELQMKYVEAANAEKKP